MNMNANELKELEVRLNKLLSETLPEKISELETVVNNLSELKKEADEFLAEERGKRISEEFSGKKRYDTDEGWKKNP